MEAASVSYPAATSRPLVHVSWLSGAIRQACCACAAAATSPRCLHVTHLHSHLQSLVHLDHPWPIPECCQVVVRYNDTTGAGVPPISTGANPAAAAGNVTCPPGGCWIASLENVKLFMQRTLSYQVCCGSAVLGGLSRMRNNGVPALHQTPAGNCVLG